MSGEAPVRAIVSDEFVARRHPGCGPSRPRLAPQRRPRPGPGVRAGFTLIELLTVITIIAILATLLMTTLSSVKRKAREAVCMSNLHQIGIALHLYLEDYNQRPTGLELLASSKYLGNVKVLSCPADRTVNNPAVAGAETTPSIKVVLTPDTTAPPASPHVSYQHPLAWPDEAWNRLMQAGTRAGITVCAFHDVRAASRNAEAALSPPYGLILRGLLDGSVVRRQVYSPDTLLGAGDAPSFVSRDAAAPPASMVAGGASAPAGNLSLPRWEFFSDDTPPENGF